MRSVVALVLLTVVLGGCATEKRLIRRLDGMVGKPVMVAIEQWGPPSHTMQDGDATIYFFRKEHSYTQPTYIARQAPGRYRVDGGETITTSCTVSLMVDSQNLIRAWRFQGSNCRSR